MRDCDFLPSNSSCASFPHHIDIAETTRLRAQAHPVVIVITPDQPHPKPTELFQHDCSWDIPTMDQLVDVVAAKDRERCFRVSHIVMGVR